MSAANDLNGSQMEIDGVEEPASVLASNVVTPTFLVSLHPLVIMNISEHWTRIRAQQDGDDKNETRVYGALIGKQKGRDTEIMNSFELKFDRLGKEIIIDFEYYNNKEKQFKQVFPDLDFLGWYTNGNEPTCEDLSVHQQMITVHESALFLKLNPLSIQSGLPIKVFESMGDLVDGKPTCFFVNIPYSIVTEEAERIGLDHMARLTSTTHGGDKSVSVVVEHLRVQYNAVKMLRDRIKLNTEFVKDSKTGQVPANQEIMRAIANLAHRLAILRADGFNEEFYTQCNDVALITHMGTLTKCTNLMNQFVNKFNVSYDRHPTPRRMKM